MKYVKMLGLAAVAAAALMAFVGASTASATVLCKTQPTEGSPATKGTVCPSSWAVAANSEIHAVNTGTVKLDTTFKTVECTGSTVKGETENEGSATETVKGKEAGAVLTFTGCNCTVTVASAGGLETHWIADTFNGTLTSSNSKVSTSCNTIFGTVHCTYVTNSTDVGTLTGGNPATLTASAHIPVLESESDAICPEESTWTATYEVTSPKPLYVAAHT